MATISAGEVNFFRTGKLLLELGPQPIREVFVFLWNSKYPADLWTDHGAGREASGRLLMEGSPTCTEPLPCTFRREAKGNVLVPEDSAVVPSKFFKPLDCITLERASARIDARVAKYNAKTNNLKASIVIDGVACPAKAEPGWHVLAPRVHHYAGTLNSTQEHKILVEGVFEWDFSGLCMVRACLY